MNSNVGASLESDSAGNVIVKLTGDQLFGNLLVSQTRLREAVDGAENEVVVDISAAAIGSACISLLLNTRDVAADRGLEFHVRPGEHRRVLEVAGLRTLLAS